MDMLTICPAGGFCDLIPSQWHWVMPPLMFLVLTLLVAIPVARILHRAGRSRWWTIIAFVPVLNLIGLWIFAFSRWPTVGRPS